MKSTGIVRKVDELGRLVLPIELRKTLDINIKDPMEIFVDGQTIILSKYKMCTCQQCGCGVREEDNFCKNCGFKLEGEN